MGNINNKQLVNFLNSRYYLQESKTFIDTILKFHPEFHYEGVAYRAIALDCDEKFSWNKKFFQYNSWAKSHLGIINFLDNYQREQTSPNEVVLVEGFIKGLDLQAVIRHLEKSAENLSHEIFQIKKEEEVLCTEFEDLQIVKGLDLYDSHIEGMVGSLFFRINEALSLDNLSGFNLKVILEDLENVCFFIDSLALEDQWNLKEVLGVLQGLKRKPSLKEVKQKLSSLGFLK